MKKCPACGYLIDEFDAVCPRCQGRGMPRYNAPPPSRPVALNVDIKQDVINGLTGFLIFLVPALIIAAFFSGHISNNPPPLPPPPSMPTGVWQPFVPQPQPQQFHAGFLPVLLAAGALLGAWIGSGLPELQWKFGSLIGGALFLVLALIGPAMIGDSGRVQTLLIYFIILLCMVCGGAGSILRYRNLVHRDDSLLIKQVGVGVLCFVMPLIGLFVSISLGKNGSEYAAPALAGSVTGFLLIGLPLLLLVLGK